MATTVVNKGVEPFDIYIGRPPHPHTPHAQVPQVWRWGNPFVIGRDGDRDTVILKFAKWFITSQDLRAQWMRKYVRELRNKRLGCFCKPEKCHGDVLAWAANYPDPLNWDAVDMTWKAQSAAYAAITLEN